MNRRDSIKSLTLSLGLTIATPTLLQLLYSCESDKTTKWDAKFLDNSQVFILEQLVDLILPASKTIGALDVNVPQFMDLVLKKICTKQEQDNFTKGDLAFRNKFEIIFKKDSSNGKQAEFLTMLNTYFKISPEKQKDIFELMKIKPSEVKDLNNYFIYKYLIFIRHYTLWGYYTSKKVGTEILNYNPIPGTYDGCTPLRDGDYISSI